MVKNNNGTDKRLKGSDIILNLNEISISSLNSFSSSSCSGNVTFTIDCSTEHGYCEDPRFLGKITILDAKKDKAKGVYNLRIKFEKDENQ